MPKIPGISYQGKSPEPVSSGSGFTTPAKDNTGAALTNLGSSLNDLGSYLEDSYQQSVAAKEVSQAQKELQDFTSRLKFGSTDPETGERIAPPPPDQHESLYQEEVSRLSDRAGNALSGKALRIFDGEFVPFSQKHGVVVKEHAMELYNNYIQTNNDEALRQDAINFVNASDTDKPGIKEKALGSIDRMVAQGVITPEQGWTKKKLFIDDSAKGSFYRVLDQNPQAAIMALKNGEFGSDLPADTQEVLTHKAYERMFTNTQRANAELDRQHKLAEWDQKERQDSTGKDLITLWSQRKLTPQAVEDNSANLSFEQKKFFLKAATGQGDVIVNPAVLADLKIKALSGMDVKDEAVKQAVAGNISVQEVSSLLDNMNSYGVTTKAANFFKRGEDYIDLNFKEKMEKGVLGASERYAEAKSQWMDWAKENPKATTEQAQKAYKDIVQHTTLIDFSTMAHNFPVPKDIEGGRANLKPDDPTTKDKILEAARTNEALYNAKQRSRAEFLREKSNIGRWLRALPVAPSQKVQE